MYKMLFVQSPLLVLPIVALGIFLSVFALVLIRTYARSAKSYDAASQLPLGDDVVAHGVSGEDSREVQL